MLITSFRRKALTLKNKKAMGGTHGLFFSVALKALRRSLDKGMSPPRPCGQAKKK